MGAVTGSATAFAMDAAGLARLLGSLRDAGFTVIGPTVRDGAIVLGEIASADDLPAGWGVELEPGGYRLRRRSDQAIFSHVAGPQSWKQFLHPPREKLWSARFSDRDFEVEKEDEPEPRKLALFGVRPCDLRAIGIQDRVLGGGNGNSRYRARRDAVLVVAVNCTEPGETCFCASMGAGPQAGSGYDLVLTELLPGSGHSFVIEAGTPAGASVIDGLDLVPADAATVEEAGNEVAAAAQHMGRSMPAGLRELMAASYDSKRWADVAARCLTCGNCTLACPTCFCTSVEDITDLAGNHAERWQHWASCFEMEFSYINGGPVRFSTASRYRQWLTHKLGTWHDQFGTSGCVGCGRCIVWCPVGIDITEEVAALHGEALRAEALEAEALEADAAGGKRPATAGRLT